MATKLTSAVAKRVKALGISAKNEEEAREALIEKLGEEGIDGMEEEDTDTLLEMLESFLLDETETEEDGETDEESEADELAEEVEEEAEEEEEEEEQPKKKAPAKKAAPAPKKSAKKAKVEEEPEEEEEEAEEEEEQPKKKVAAKAPAKKEEKKAPAKKSPAKRGSKLNPKSVESDRAYFDPLKKLFPDKDYAYAWVASSGVTIKNKGKNSSRSMVLIENCALKDEGKKVTCNLYLLTFAKKTDILEEKGIDFEICWSGAPLIKNITLEEAIQIIKELLEDIIASVTKIDKKLGENRKKMEDNLSKKKPAAKKAKVEEETEEEEEETEEEEEQPKKKATSKKAAPVAKKAKKVVEEDEEEEQPKKKSPAKKAAPAPAKKTTKKK
jgi:outer membrane biosynthesis protein TonB